MNTKQKNAKNVRQVLLLIMAQTLAITSMIWGGSVAVDAQEPEALAGQIVVTAEPCHATAAQGKTQQQASGTSSKQSSVKLLDFSIGMPWG